MAKPPCLYSSGIFTSLKRSRVAINEKAMERGETILGMSIMFMDSCAQRERRCKSVPNSTPKGQSCQTKMAAKKLAKWLGRQSRQYVAQSDSGEPGLTYHSGV